MNAKKAKQIRRVARSMTTGMPASETKRVNRRLKNIYKESKDK